MGRELDNLGTDEGRLKKGRWGMRLGVVRELRERGTLHRLCIGALPRHQDQLKPCMKGRVKKYIISGEVGGIMPFVQGTTCQPFILTISLHPHLSSSPSHFTLTLHPHQLTSPSSNPHFTLTFHPHHLTSPSPIILTISLHLHFITSPPHPSLQGFPSE